MKFRNSRIWRTSVAVAAAAGVAIALSACASGAPGGAEPSAGGGTGSVEGNGASVVVFMPTTSNSYIRADADAIKAEGEKLGYEVGTAARIGDRL